ncbi:MAG: hypothetical protein CMC81_04635 [Flavobacteriaceae bacterium]|nr:hypothetical protein [Flavobacteriaceae bacterium]
MASIRNLKKEMNNSIGSLIEDIYSWELNNPKVDIKKTESLIDESIVLFDRLIIDLNKRDKNKPKLFYNSIKKKLDSEIEKISLKLSKLK